MVVNEDRFFLSHRKNIALAAKNAGYQILIACKDTGQHKDIKNLGLEVIEMPVNPTGMNITEELKTFFFLKKLYKREKPDIVHHVGLKCILWGGLAAKFNRVRAVVNAVSGLGVLFDGEELSLVAKTILRFISFSCKRMKTAEIFQNQEDKSLFIKSNIIDEKDCYFIKGSGVDLNEYEYTPEPSEGKLRVLFTARMVREKGVLTLIKAAEVLRKDFQDKAEFILCGGLSSNPNSIKEEELRTLCDDKYIKWLGHRTDVLNQLKKCHIFAFPSYYREGVPRSLIEASAIGRPLVTCNSIGCKDVVDDGVNGFLVQPCDSDSLAHHLRALLCDAQLRQKMGQASRRKAESEFSIESVNDKHLQIYHRILNNN